MIDQINRGLLVDLARLFRRYPLQDWQKIIEWLEDDARRNQIITLIREFSVVSKPATRKTQRDTKISGVPRYLEELQLSDPVKVELLQEIRRKFMDSKNSPTLGSLRTFAENLGMRGLDLRKRRREQIVDELIKQLAGLKYEEIQNVLNNAFAEPRDFGDEYKRWVNLILGPGKTGTTPDKPEDGH